MASSSASMTASKLFNLTKPTLQSLIRRHLIRPSTQLIQSTSAPHEQIADSLNCSLNATILDLNNASNFPINLRMPFNSALPHRIQMARTYVPNNAEEEFDDDEDDDDDDDDDEDIQYFSGSNLEDEDDEEFDDASARPRRYKE